MATRNRAQLPAAISEPITWQTICERYPDEWVCLAEIDWVNDTDFSFGTARVIGHGKARRESFEQARPWRDRYPSIGHFFTGPIRVPLPHHVLP